MFPPFISATLLALEAQTVIVLRALKIAGGDHDAAHEARLMMAEKVDAAWEAAHSLSTGGTAAAVIDRYRDLVAANVQRLRRA
ncbi:MAG: hypothetical protein ACLP1D_03635 [Xanthobacteraceae bacterium]